MIPTSSPEFSKRGLCPEVRESNEPKQMRKRIIKMLLCCFHFFCACGKCREMRYSSYWPGEPGLHLCSTSWEQPVSAHSRQTKCSCAITTPRSFSSCFQLFFWEKKNSRQGVLLVVSSQVVSPAARQSLQPHLTREKQAQGGKCFFSISSSTRGRVQFLSIASQKQSCCCRSSW